METKDIITMELDNVRQGMTRLLDGLNHQELSWRPAYGCNSIGLIVFHMARFEDSTLQARIQGKPEVWESEKWYQKLNLPVTEAGAHYNVEQVNAFPVPELRELMGYTDAVRQRTMQYLKNVTPDQLDKRITMPRSGETPIAAVFARVVGHLFQHIGEISYLRGLNVEWTNSLLTNTFCYS